MNKPLIYSILQYKHSPVLGEAINVGVLFYFSGERKQLYFVASDSSRIKSIYKDFDVRYFNNLMKGIQSGVNKCTGDWLAEDSLTRGLKGFIHEYLLRYDDTSLQFSEIFSTVNVFDDIDSALKEYSRLLLPVTYFKENQPVKHDEKFLLKRFKSKLLSHKEIKNRIQSNYTVNYQQLSFKFEIAWQNGTLNLVKPVSFDLQDAQSIQRKTAEYCSYLSWLDGYTREQNCRIDLLLAEPQDKKLFKAYDHSVKLLEEVQSNKKMVFYDQIDDYSDKAIEYLMAL